MTGRLGVVLSSHPPQRPDGGLRASERPPLLAHHITPVVVSTAAPVVPELEAIAVSCAVDGLTHTNPVRVPTAPLRVESSEETPDGVVGVVGVYRQSGRGRFGLGGIRNFGLTSYRVAVSLWTESSFGSVCVCGYLLRVTAVSLISLPLWSNTRVTL